MSHLISLSLLFAGCDAPATAPEVAPQAEPFPLTGLPEDGGLGWSVAASDLDGDGFGDVLLSTAPSGEGTPIAYLFYGPVEESLSAVQADAWFVGLSAEVAANISVSLAGDVTGDGVGDLLLGAREDASAGDGAGAAWLIPGPVQGEVDLGEAITFYGEQPGDYAGQTVAGAGDLNGDGVGDLLISGHHNDLGGDNAGVVYAFFGPIAEARSLAEADARLIGVSAGDKAGWSVAPLGDINADGYADVAVGAPWESSAGEWAGATYLILGPLAGDLSLSEADARWTGEREGDWSGWSVAAAGDVDGDGVGELLIGAYGESSAGEWAGAAYLVSGLERGERSLSDALARLSGEGAMDTAGAAVASAGDVDGDGDSELLIGAPGSESQADHPGRAYLIYGPVAGERSLARADQIWEGGAPGSLMGRALAAGDLSGDGAPELMIGSPQDSTAGAGAGAAWIQPGAAALR